MLCGREEGCGGTAKLASAMIVTTSNVDASCKGMGTCLTWMEDGISKPPEWR